MKRNKFVKYCTSYVCDKQTAQEYVDANVKSEYTSEDTENVYRRYRRKQDEKNDVGSACTGRIYAYGSICRTTKKYE